MVKGPRVALTELAVSLGRPMWGHTYGPGRSPKCARGAGALLLADINRGAPTKCDLGAPAEAECTECGRELGGSPKPAQEG